MKPSEKRTAHTFLWYESWYRDVPWYQLSQHSKLELILIKVQFTRILYFLCLQKNFHNFSLQTLVYNTKYNQQMSYDLILLVKILLTYLVNKQVATLFFTLTYFLVIYSGWESPEAQRHDTKVTTRYYHIIAICWLVGNNLLWFSHFFELQITFPK